MGYRLIFFFMCLCMNNIGVTGKRKKSITKIEIPLKNQTYSDIFTKQD